MIMGNSSRIGNMENPEHLAITVSCQSGSSDDREVRKASVYWTEAYFKICVMLSVIVICWTSILSLWNKLIMPNLEIGELLMFEYKGLSILSEIR